MNTQQFLFHSIIEYYRYDEFIGVDESTPEKVLEKYEAITNLVEHPTKLKPPGRYNRIIYIHHRFFCCCWSKVVGLSVPPPDLVINVVPSVVESFQSKKAVQ